MVSSSGKKKDKINTQSSSNNLTNFGNNNSRKNFFFKNGATFSNKIKEYFQFKIDSGSSLKSALINFIFGCHCKYSGRSQFSFDSLSNAITLFQKLAQKILYIQSQAQRSRTVH